MKKRSFLKTCAVGIAGTLSLPVIANKANLTDLNKQFELPTKPLFDKQLQAFYKENIESSHKALNQCLHSESRYPQTVREILENQTHYSKETVFHSGRFFNAKYFLKNISSGKHNISPQLTKAIKSNFGSLDSFKKKFELSESVNTQGSYTWLVLKKNRLQIINTKNHVALFEPGKEKCIPLICKYADPNFPANKFWEFVNWEFASEKYAKKRLRFS